MPTVFWKNICIKSVYEYVAINDSVVTLPQSNPRGTLEVVPAVHDVAGFW